MFLEVRLDLLPQLTFAVDFPVLLPKPGGLGHSRPIGARTSVSTQCRRQTCGQERGPRATPSRRGRRQVAEIVEDDGGTRTAWRDRIVQLQRRMETRAR